MLRPIRELYRDRLSRSVRGSRDLLLRAQKSQPAPTLFRMERGQHPHAKAVGSYDIATRTFKDAGPESWANNGEVDRIRWDESHMGEPKAGYNPIGHYAPTSPTRVNRADLALAQMSKLQRKQLDKDGDGQFSAAELAAHGFSVGEGESVTFQQIEDAPDASRGNVRMRGDGIWAGRGAFSHNKGAPAMLAMLPPEATVAAPHPQLTQSSVPAAGMANYIRYNAFATRRPDLFSGSGATPSTATEVEQQGALPRSRDKSLSPPEKPPRPPPKQGFGLATEHQVSAHFADDFRG